MVSTETVESLLDDMGGCGLFQWLIMVLVHSPTLPAAWTFIFMVYGGYNPGWTCADQGLFNVTTTWPLFDVNVTSNSTTGETPSCDVYTDCKHVVYNSDSSTIVTEWDLACDRNWIASTILSLESVGTLIGVIGAGLINQHFGRKASLYGTLFFNAIFNLVSMFSVNWLMYAAMRLLSGITIASLYLCTYVYPVEFLNPKWRGVYVALPLSNISFVLFAVAAMFLRDWRTLHLLTAIMSFVLMLPVFWVPDSLRWLIVTGKREKALRACEKIAKINRTSPPSMEIIDTLTENETGRGKDKPTRTVLDLCRHGFLVRTLVMAYMFFSCNIVYSIVIFGVKNLSGNFYVNLTIFGFITTSTYVFVPCLSNTIGRKWTVFLFMSLGVVCCFGLVCVSVFRGDIDDEGLWMMILSLALLSFVDGAWETAIVYTMELYPTTLRTLGYAQAGSWARLGAILAPFLIPDGDPSSFFRFIVSGIVILIAVVLIAILPETKGKQMPDTIGSHEVVKREHREVEEML